MKKKAPHADKYIFIVCLTVSVSLAVGGFFCPPMGVIDGSVITTCGLLLGYAALAVGAQNLANGKEVTFSHGETEVTIEEDHHEEQ